MKKNKGQSSIEYLLIYVFALGIILSAIATFTYLNSTDKNSNVPETCTFDVNLGCRDFQVSEDGNVELNIKNTIKITIATITLRPIITWVCVTSNDVLSSIKPCILSIILFYIHRKWQ